MRSFELQASNSKKRKDIEKVEVPQFFWRLLYSSKVLIHLRFEFEYRNAVLLRGILVLFCQM